MWCHYWQDMDCLAPPPCRPPKEKQKEQDAACSRGVSTFYDLSYELQTFLVSVLFLVLQEASSLKKEQLRRKLCNSLSDDVWVCCQKAVLVRSLSSSSASWSLSPLSCFKKRTSLTVVDGWNIYRDVHPSVHPSYLIDKRRLFQCQVEIYIYLYMGMSVQKPPSRGCHLHLVFGFDYETPTIYAASIRTRAASDREDKK